MSIIAFSARSPPECIVAIKSPKTRRRLHAYYYGQFLGRSSTHGIQNGPVEEFAEVRLQFSPRYCCYFFSRLIILLPFSLEVTRITKVIVEPSDMFVSVRLFLITDVRDDVD